MQRCNSVCIPNIDIFLYELVAVHLASAVCSSTMTPCRYKEPSMWRFDDFILASTHIEMIYTLVNVWALTAMWRHWLRMRITLVFWWQFVRDWHHPTFVKSLDGARNYVIVPHVNHSNGSDTTDIRGTHIISDTVVAVRRSYLNNTDSISRLRL